MREENQKTLLFYLIITKKEDCVEYQISKDDSNSILNDEGVLLASIPVYGYFVVEKEPYDKERHYYDISDPIKSYLSKYQLEELLLDKMNKFIKIPELYNQYLYWKNIFKKYF